MSNLKGNLDLSESAKEGSNKEDSGMESVIKTLKKMADFLERNKVKNTDIVGSVKEALSNMESSMKYVAIDEGPSFNDLPPELTSRILSSLSVQSKLVVASVCQNWSDLVTPDLKNITDIGLQIESESHGKGIVIINKDRFSPSIVMTQDVMKGLTVLKLDTGLKLNLHYNNTPVDFELLAKCSKKVSTLNVYYSGTQEDRKLKLIIDAMSREESKLENCYFNVFIDWQTILSPQELTLFLGNIKSVEMKGIFTPDQIEAAKTVAHIDVKYVGIVYGGEEFPAMQNTETFMISKRLKDKYDLLWYHGILLERLQLK